MGAGGPVVGVVGGSGGVGASTFAAVLAVVAAAVLVDLDTTGGGADVVLGLEQAPGARWSGLRLAGGHLDPAALRAGLPDAGGCAVLAADVAELDPEAVLQVVASASSTGPVVLDLPRAAGPARAAGLLCCDLLVVVARPDVAGLVAAHALVAALPELPLGLVVRAAVGGGVAPREAADLVGAPLLGRLPALSGPGVVLDPARPPRPLARVAAGVLAGARRGPDTLPRELPAAARHAAVAG